MILVVFRSRLRPEAGEEYTIRAKEIASLAERQSGYISHKTFASEDGERVTLALFDNEDAALAWRHHPEHRLAQQQGRERFYSEYSVQVCSVLRDYSFAQEDSRL